MRAAPSISFVLGLRAILGLLTLALMGSAPAWADRTWVYHPEPDLVREREFAYAIDGVHRRAYRFGGKVDGVLSGELKRQDLDDPDLTWSLVPASPGPPARFLSCFFDDVRRDRLLLLGGYDAGVTGHADVWAFDLATATWSQLSVGPGGPAAILNEYPMTYDTRRDRLVYLNAQAADGYTKVWTLDLGTLEWSGYDAESNFKLVPEIVPDPPYRFVSAAAYDSLGDRLFLQGAFHIDVLYQLDMSDLSAPSAFVALPGSAFLDFAPRLAVDTAGNRLIVDVLDGGGSGMRMLQSRNLSSPSLATSWSADYAPDWTQTLAWAVDPVAGTIEVPVQGEREMRSTLDLKVPRWSSRHKTGRLRASDDMAGAIDPTGRAIYVYGGSIHVYRNDSDHTTITDDALFRLDADDPTAQEWLHPLGQGPGPLRGAMAVLDSIGRRIVFLGGADSSGVIRSEVWALDLDPEPHWSPLATQTAGPARLRAGAAIDPVSRILYLMGGTAPGADPHPGFLWSLDLSKTPAEWNLLIADNPDIPGTVHVGYDRVNDRFVGVNPRWKFAIDLVPGGPPDVRLYEWGTPGLETQIRIGLMGAFDEKRNLMFTQGGWYSVMTVRGPFETGVWSGTVFADKIATLGVPPPPPAKGLAVVDPGRDRFVIINGDRIRVHNVSDFDDCVGTFGAWTLDLDDAVPTLLDLADVAIETRGVRVRFSGEGAESPVRVERTIDGTLEWAWIGDAREVSPGTYEWIDENVVPGMSYRYRGRYTSDGEERITAVSQAMLVPGAVEVALTAPGATVGRGWPVALEGRVVPGISARVELVDIAGRVVSRRAVSGVFSTSLAPQRPSAGIYFARLVQGDRTFVLKLVRF